MFLKIIRFHLIAIIFSLTYEILVLPKRVTIAKENISKCLLKETNADHGPMSLLSLVTPIVNKMHKLPDLSCFSKIS